MQFPNSNEEVDDHIAEAGAADRMKETLLRPGFRGNHFNKSMVIVRLE